MNRLIIFYKQLFEDNKLWLGTVTNWFILSAFVGAITFFVKPGILQTILSAFAERFGDNPALDFHLVLQIFLQNFIVSLVAIFGGLILGLGPFLVVAINGFLIGFVVCSILFVNQNFFQSIAIIVGGLAPHGIFELPAFLLSSALGLRLGIDWIAAESAGNRKAIFKNNFKKAMQALPAIAFILFISALLEVYVSGNLVNNF